MLRGFFVTGTDTNVGKTVVCSALMHRYRGAAALRYWKPVQTGADSDDDTATVRDLGDCTDVEILDAGIRLPDPVSPHLAADWREMRIDVASLADYIAHQPRETRWIVEGAGGILVPLNESEFVVDLILRLALPVVLVARSSIGTINHTLLTLEALRRRAIVVAGIVMVGNPDEHNRKALTAYGQVEVLGMMPWASTLNSEWVREWATADLDRRSRLAGYLL